MSNIFIPGVRQSWGGTYGWSLLGGPKKFVLHSTECDSAPGIVDQVAHRLDGWANPTLVWDPWTGDMCMSGRADWGMGALVSGNRDGSVVLQVEAIGWADGHSPNLGTNGWRPFADSRFLGWPTILAWADSWGIPRTFPAGAPLPYPQSYGTGSPRSPQAWNNSGYFGHSQVPGNDHGDPGVVDLAKIFAGAAPSNDSGADIMAGMHTVDTGGPLNMQDPTIRTLQGLLEARGGMINPVNSNHAVLTTVVKWFQGQAKLTADGIVGPQTWNALVVPLAGR